MDLPGRATTYLYQGNQVTGTNPKRYIADVFGNVLHVTEPSSAQGGADHETAYTYDLLNHLTQVQITAWIADGCPK